MRCHQGSADRKIYGLRYIHKKREQLKVQRSKFPFQEAGIQQQIRSLKMKDMKYIKKQKSMKPLISNECKI